MGKTRSHQVRDMAVSASSSTDLPDIQSSRPSSRTSLRFVQDSLQKIYPSHASSSTQIQYLQNALNAAKIVNAKHQEQIEALTVERDAAESELHTTKRLSNSLQEDFCHSETTLEKNCALLQSALRQNEAQQMALAVKEKELEAKDKEIECLRLEASDQNSEIASLLLKSGDQSRKIESLTDDNLLLEDWISEIKARVQEANTSYSNLENKIQTQNGIILQLKAENARLDHRHESDIINLEMNKKALVRSNMDLKRSCEDLQAKLQEQEKAKEVQPAFDWKAECLKIHKHKSIQIKNLKDQTERLQVENQEQYMELCELKAVRNTKLVDSVSSTARPTAENEFASNGISGIVTLFDVPPSEAAKYSSAVATSIEKQVASNSTSEIVTLVEVAPGQVMDHSSAVIAPLQPAKTLESRAFSDLAGVMVFSGCLLSALSILGSC